MCPMTRALDTERHRLALAGMPRERIEAILDLAESLASVASGESPPLDVATGRIVANLFFEDSTRTRSSFTIAARRLGADTVDVSGHGSSISKGETFLDTARNLEAMGVAALVIRSPSSGTAVQVARAVACPVVNAGDGRHEHPTQGLLDALTLRQQFGDLTGRRIAIVGDIANSRVARSNLHGLTTLGADVLLVGPPALVPAAFDGIAAGPGRVAIGHDLDAVLEDVDAIMMLRIQRERQAGDAIAPDYRRHYGLTVERAGRLRPGTVVMHPGPMNRGLEIDGEVADDPERSVILRQVANAVAVRMAVLARCLDSIP